MTSLLVNIDVDDLARATQFYTRAFGMRVGRRLGATTVELLGLGAPVYLLLKPAGTPPFAGANPSARDYRRHWTPVHLDVVVEELEPALERALGAGARAESETLEYPWGRIVYLSDPFGHGFCLLQFSEQGYDAVTN